MLIHLAKKARSAVRGAHSLATGFDQPNNTLILTGIPRSGTSLISSLLNQVEDVICFNEIYYDAYRLPQKLNRVRQDLIEGNPVPNKYGNNGQLTTDTMGGVEVVYRSQAPMSEGVVVASNVNVPYLQKMEFIQRLGCPVVAAVRDPVCTVASYSSSRTSWIPEANAGPAPHAMHPRWKPIKFSGRTPIERRAEVWNYIAGLILKHRLPVVQYEALVADPRSSIESILARTGFEGRVPPLEPLKSGNRRYDDLCEVREAVERFAPNRIALGYD